MKTIKTLVFAACFFGASAALAQSGGTVLNSDVQPFHIGDHPNRASQQPVAAEQSLLSQNSITFAQGERPLSEFAVAEVSEPLGDVARRLKQEHEGVKKASTVWAKQ